MAAVRFSLLELRPFISSDPRLRLRRAARLMRTPYLAGGCLECIAGARNPVGMYLVALSAAAASFGGTSGLVWMDNWLKDVRTFPLGPEAAPPSIGRSWPWIAAAACAAVVFVLVLGPGIRIPR